MGKFDVQVRRGGFVVNFHYPEHGTEPAKTDSWVCTSRDELNELIDEYMAFLATIS